MFVPVFMMIHIAVEAFEALGDPITSKNHRTIDVDLLWELKKKKEVYAVCTTQKLQSFTGIFLSLSLHSVKEQ